MAVRYCSVISSSALSIISEGEVTFIDFNTAPFIRIYPSTKRPQLNDKKRNLKKDLTQSQRPSWTRSWIFFWILVVL